MAESLQILMMWLSNKLSFPFDCILTMLEKKDTAGVCFLLVLIGKKIAWLWKPLQIQMQCIKITPFPSPVMVVILKQSELCESKNVYAMVRLWACV